MAESVTLGFEVTAHKRPHISARDGQPQGRIFSFRQLAERQWPRQNRH